MRSQLFSGLSAVLTLCAVGVDHGYGFVGGGKSSGPGRFRRHNIKGWQKPKAKKNGYHKFRRYP